MNLEEVLERGYAALEDGRWHDACSAFEAVLREAGPPRALAGLGDALFFLGEINESVRYRERAYAACRRAGDLPNAVDSAVWLCLVFAMSLGNEVAARGWLARAQSLVADSDEGLMQAWVDYCSAILANDNNRSRALLEQVLRLARTYGDVDLEVCALAELGVVLVKGGEIEAGLRCVDEAMAGALGGDRTTFYTVVMTSCSMLTVCDLLGDLNRATKWSRAADNLMRHHGCPYLHAECRLVHGRVLLLTGHWTEAEDDLRKAAVCTRETFPGMYHRTIASLAELRLRQGRPDESEALIEAIEAPIETALVAAALALRREQPLVATALIQRWLRSEADPVVPPIHAGGRGLSIEVARAVSLLVEARLAAGDLEAAVANAEELKALASASGGGLAAAHAALALARIAVAQGSQDVAILHFEEALALYGQSELPLEGAQTRVELARALASRQPALAVAEARTALSVLDRLGASADADVAAALLRSWGAAGRSVPRDLGILTRREKEILSLLAAGLSNQQIADRLYISRRTAAHHVSNVFAKLGVRNRAEAVSFVARSRAETEVVGEPS